MNNLFAGLSGLGPLTGTAASGSSSGGSEPSPQDIPKEELMNLCMKMNKRMQAMETKGKELVKKKGSLLLERAKLLELMKMVIPVPSLSRDGDDLDVLSIESEWLVFDSRRKAQDIENDTKLAAKEKQMNQIIQELKDKYTKTILDLQLQLVSGKSSDGESSAATRTVDHFSPLLDLTEPTPPPLPVHPVSNDATTSVALTTDADNKVTV
jgi:hypothetical protein